MYGYYEKNNLKIDSLQNGVIIFEYILLSILNCVVVLSVIICNFAVKYQTSKKLKSVSLTG